MNTTQAVFTLGAMAYSPAHRDKHPSRVMFEAMSAADTLLTLAKKSGLKKITPVKSMWRRGVPSKLAMERTAEVCALVPAHELARVLRRVGALQ